MYVNNSGCIQPQHQCLEIKIKIKKMLEGNLSLFLQSSQTNKNKIAENGGIE